MEFSWHLYLMAAFYIVAGINHFRVPQMYLRIIPPVLPAPKILNIISGIAEIVFSILLLTPKTSSWGAWGIIVLLIAIFPANIYMLINQKSSFGLLKWILLARLPLQLVLLYWAYLYT